jgi:acetyl esterase/lipase
MKKILKWRTGIILILGLLIILVGLPNTSLSIVSAETGSVKQITIKKDDIKFKYKNIINLDLITFNEYKERWKRDIVYKEVDGSKLTLDLFLPTIKITNRYPVVVYVHGGGFIRGDKDEILDLKPLLKSWLEEGWAVVSVNYRLLYGNTMFPDNYKDITDALNWINENQETYKFNTSKISLVGHSAGGSLALLAGLESDKVDSIVSLAGPTTLYGKENFELRKRLINLLSNKKLNQDMLKKASPITHLSKSSSPVLLIHGSQDHFVPYRQSQAFYDKAKELGVTSKFITIEGGGHILEMSYLPRLHEFEDEIIKFMKNSLEK